MATEKQMDVEVRVAHPEDLSTINTLAHLCWGGGERLDRLPRFEGMKYLVATLDQCQCGYLSYLALGARLAILSLGVHPECRQCGVGSGLLEAVQATGAQLGKPCRLVLRSDNYLGRRCAASVGFRCAGVMQHMMAYEWTPRNVETSHNKRAG